MHPGKGRWCRKVARRDQSLARSWHDRHESARIGTICWWMGCKDMVGKGDRSQSSFPTTTLCLGERDSGTPFFTGEKGEAWRRVTRHTGLLAPEPKPKPIVGTSGVSLLRGAGCWSLPSPRRDRAPCPVLRVAWSGGGGESTLGTLGTPILFTRPRAPHLCWL